MTTVYLFTLGLVCGQETRAESCSVTGVAKDLPFMTVFEASSGTAGAHRQGMTILKNTNVQYHVLSFGADAQWS
jgi:hypothetical protein